MSAKRKATETKLLAFMKEFDKSGNNHAKWTEILKGMSDKDFDDYMKGIRTGEKTLVGFAEHTKSGDITTDNNLKMAKKYGIPMFERIVHTNGPSIDFTSRQEYLMLMLSSRRQSQNLVGKISVPKDMKSIDHLVYQPTGDSKGSSLSEPEARVLIGMGLNNSVEELMRARGGDKGGRRAYETSIARLGSVRLDAIAPYMTGVKSTQVLKAYLLTMHLAYKD